MTLMKTATLFLCLGLLVVGASTGMGSSADDLMSTAMTRDQLARMLVEVSKSPINTNALRNWADKLGDKQLIKTDGSFESQLEVRDVALTVLEAITGESFVPNKPGKTTPVKEILVCQVKDTTWRFHITKLTDDDYVTVSHDVDYWIAGYLQAASSKKTLAK
jgi:hypothetical protein